MAKSTETTPDDGSMHADFKVLKDEWCWILSLGIGLIFLGGFAVTSTYFAAKVTVLLLGLALIASGVGQLMSFLRSPKWSGHFLQLLSAILYLVVGYLVIDSPASAVKGLTMVMALFFIFSGILRISVSLIERFPHWGWTAMSGVITLFLGLLIKKQWPESELWVIGLFVGIELIVNGWTFVALGLTAKRLADES